MNNEPFSLTTEEIADGKRIGEILKSLTKGNTTLESMTKEKRIVLQGEVCPAGINDGEGIWTFSTIGLNIKCVASEIGERKFVRLTLEEIEEC